MPPTETAPSVPGGTRRKSGRRTVGVFSACPTSVPTVSMRAVAKAAAAARRSRRGGAGRQRGAGDEERRDRAVREDVRRPAPTARLLRLSHRLLALAAEAGRERPAAEEGPEEGVGAPAPEAEDECRRRGLRRGAPEGRTTRRSAATLETTAFTARPRRSCRERAGREERGRVRNARGEEPRGRRPPRAAERGCRRARTEGSRRRPRRVRREETPRPRRAKGTAPRRTRRGPGRRGCRRGRSRRSRSSSFRCSTEGEVRRG